MGICAPVIHFHWEVLATSVKCTPDVSKPFKKKNTYIIGPRLAASESEVVSICSPAGSFLIPSAVSFSFFCIIVNVLFLSQVQLGKYFIPFCAA